MLIVDDEAGEGIRNTAHHAQTVNSLFPSCLCSAVIHIVGLLDDAAVSQDGNAVYEVAYQVKFWNISTEIFFNHCYFSGDMVLSSRRFRPIFTLRIRKTY